MKHVGISSCDVHRHTLAELFEIVKVRLAFLQVEYSFVLLRKRQRFMKTVLPIPTRIRQSDQEDLFNISAIVIVLRGQHS